MKRHHFMELAQNANGQPVELNDNNFNELVVMLYPDKTEEQVAKYKKIIAFGVVFERAE